MAAVSASFIAFPDEVDATSSTMLAPGAMAWAYSTSRLVSIVQPNTSCRGLALILTTGHVLGSSGVGELPQDTVKVVGAGMRKCTSSNTRSTAVVGRPTS